MTLRDISEGGVGFTLAAPCDLQPGWLITVFFELSGSERHRPRIVIRFQTAEAMRRVTLSLANPHTPLPTGQDLRRETCAVNLS